MTLRETGPAVARVVWWRSPFHLDDVRRTVLEMEGQRHCCEREGAAAAWLFMLHGMRKIDGARSIRDSIHVGGRCVLGIWWNRTAMPSVEATKHHAVWLLGAVLCSWLAILPDYPGRVGCRLSVALVYLSSKSHGVHGNIL
jgi:hypothetical protein